MTINWCCIVVAAFALPTTLRGQIIGCQPGVSFPAPATDQSLVLDGGPVDGYLAVGPGMIVLTTNEMVQLRCRAGGGLVSGAPTFPLRGASPTLCSGR